MTNSPLSMRWDNPRTVGGFAASPPNATLLAYAREERRRQPSAVALDLGCGAARNAAPLAADGWRVVGVDLSAPMLAAARERAAKDAVGDSIEVIRAGMDRLPFPDAAFDLVIAHGIWNLARSGDEFRRAVAEAARVARGGAGLFLFTFSRHTLADAAQPVAGEEFVFTQFSGEPQCFLTEEQVLAELACGGLALDPVRPLTELNRPPGSRQRLSGGPVIYEGTFRRRGSDGQ